MNHEPLADRLTPSEVMEQVAQAMPPAVRGNVIIVGSLAAGYNFFSGDGAASMRTKDVDMLLSPHAVAVDAAVEVTEALLAANWTQKADGRFGQGGSPQDDVKSLPVVRLRPPAGETASAAWFLELLSAPPAYQAGTDDKKERRLHTRAGDFMIPSFDYLALAEWHPLPTAPGVLMARPEMMALANMLHHPAIGEKLIADTTWKRSNKDLGRVLALAYLTLARDRRDETNELEQWGLRMWDALREKFGDNARQLALGAGSGIEALLASQADLEQALRIANLGLLSSLDINMRAIEATGRQFREEVIGDLLRLAHRAAA